MKIDVAALVSSPAAADSSSEDDGDRKPLIGSGKGKAIHGTMLLDRENRASSSKDGGRGGQKTPSHGMVPSDRESRVSSVKGGGKSGSAASAAGAAAGAAAGGAETSNPAPDLEAAKRMLESIFLRETPTQPYVHLTDGTKAFGYSVAVFTLQMIADASKAALNLLQVCLIFMIIIGRPSEYVLCTH
jgi:hypothetical protein